ncbi:MAG: hypothetical protein NWF05_05040 [Candidatus Bathyarchaeota archaeon]|nr:hypothetical protein [Candidatus Bathyarchaeota archaeon]
MPQHTNPKHEQTLKAGALLCPVCCVEYVEIEVDFELDGQILRDVKVLRCPICQDEQFTPQQQKAIEEQLRRKIEP